MTSRIPPAEMTGIKAAIVKRMSRRMFGEVLEPTAVIWHNQKVTSFSFSVGRQSQKWDACDENLKSMAHMARRRSPPCRPSIRSSGKLSAPRPVRQ